MRIINQFEPFGPGNMTPVFMAENLKDSGYAKGVGAEESHLKCAVFQPPNTTSKERINAIGFNLGNKLDIVTQGTFNAVFSMDENEWQGKTSLQLRIRDIKEN